MGGLGETWECEYKFRVEREHVAEHLAAEGEYVLSTPCLILYMERAARMCLDSRTGKVSVGYRVDMKHRKSVPPGRELTLYARVFYWDGRRALVYVRAEDDTGSLVGEGINERFAKS
ncbi:MAG: hypothetical protein F7C35_03615 [Desulfurococcales archaeon]|nr:hypothetical protein [Desulfurococcales archaeon]